MLYEVITFVAAIGVRTRLVGHILCRRAGLAGRSATGDGVIMDENPAHAVNLFDKHVLDAGGDGVSLGDSQLWIDSYNFV